MRSFLYKKLKLFGPGVVSALLIFLPLGIAVADSPNVTSGDSPNIITGDSPNINSGSSGNCGNTDPNVLQNPLKVCSIQDLIVLLVNAAVVIGIPIAVLFIVYAGFKFIMARGSPSGLTEARANLVATLIGVAIFVGASLIADVIVNTLNQLGASTTLH